MLSLFRTNQILANVLLLAYIALVRSSFLFVPSATVFKPQGIYSYEISHWIGTQHWIEPFVAALVIFIQAISINVLCFKYRMSDEKTLFAGIFYILMVSICPDFMGLSSPLLAVTFIILAFIELFSSYRQGVASGNIFNVGLMLGISSMFCFSISTYLIWAFIGLSILRKGSLKEISMVLVGFFTVYFLVGTFYFVLNRYDFFWNEQISKNIRFLNFTGENNWISYGIRLVYALLIGLSIVSQGFYSSKKSIQVQKFQTVLYWSLIIAAAPLLIQSNVSTHNLVLLAPTLAIFVTYHFLQFERQMAEAVHLICLAIVLALQYHSWLGF